VKNARAYRLLFIANAVSGLSQGICMLAIPWYFSKILGKPELFGMMYAATTFIMIFWGLYAGSLIDRFSRRHVFMAVNAFGLLLLGSVSAIGFYQGSVPAWGAMLVFAGTILVYNIHYPALYAFGQEITEKQYYGRFTSWTEIIGQSTSILSGSAAALLLSGVSEGDHHFAGLTINFPFEIKAWTLQEVFLTDAITYLIGFFLIALIRYEAIAIRHQEAGSALDRIRTGMKFLKDNPLIFQFGNASYAIFVVLLVTFQQLLPQYIDQHLHSGAGTYAFAEVMYSIGAMLAGVFMVWTFRKSGFILGITVMMGITVLIYALFASSSNLLLFSILCLLVGITNAGTRVLRTTWLFQHVPNQSIGRVSSVFQTINILFRAGISSLFALPFFNRNDQIVYAFAVCAVFVGLWMIPILRNYKKLANFKMSS
jgi:MFS family permease